MNQRGLVVKKACLSSYRIPAVLPPRKLLLVGFGRDGVDVRRSHVFKEKTSLQEAHCSKPIFSPASLWERRMLRSIDDNGGRWVVERHIEMWMDF